MTTMAQFIQANGPSALAVQAKTGIDAATMLAISVQEGVLDPTTIAAQGAFFGVKASNSQPSGDAGVITIASREVINGVTSYPVSTFNKYSSFGAAINGFVQFLQANGYNTSNGNDPASFLAGLQSKHYATDPGWANSVLGIRNQIAPLLTGMQPGTLPAGGGSTTTGSSGGTTDTSPGSSTTTATTTTGTGGTAPLTTNTSGLGAGEVQIGELLGQPVSIPSGMVLAALAVVLLLIGAILFLANSQTVKVEALKGAVNSQPAQIAAKVLP
jgi:hypothetical protein